MAYVRLFEVDHQGEPDAGVSSYSDKVTVIVQSGNPGGEESGDESFQEFMRETLAEWFDGASIRLQDDADALALSELSSNNHRGWRLWIGEDGKARVEDAGGVVHTI